MPFCASAIRLAASAAVVTVARAPDRPRACSCARVVAAAVSEDTFSPTPAPKPDAACTAWMVNVSLTKLSCSCALT